MDILQLMKSVNIFPSVSEAELNKILQKLHVVQLRKAKVLFKQGSISHDLYILLSGALITVLIKENQEVKILDTIYPGETVGEIGAVSKEPRVATVKALEDSILLKFSSEEFEKLIKQHPSLLQGAFLNLMKRSQTLIKLVSDKQKARTQVTLVPATAGVHIKNFAEKMQTFIRKNDGIIVLADFDPAIAALKEEELKKMINEAIENQKIILYILESAKSKLAVFGFQNVDAIYIIGDGYANASVDACLLKEIENNEKTYRTKLELILLHKSSEARPEHTEKWLDLLKFDLHHHLRMNREKDWERVLRFIRGRAVGLVFGGGGLRCWAHLGAIRALEKAGIPIDIVGGTSAGAIVAGHYGMHETDKNFIPGLQELSEIARKAISLRNLTWPAVSVFNSKDYTHKLYELFGGMHIEDLWIGCFCITTNLSNYSQMVYRRGRLWKTIRSSSSVPGVFPPVVIKGKLQTDGGILNNLPVDVMRKFVGPQGTVVAIELTHLNEDNTEYHFPPILTFWQAALAKLRIAHRNYRFPHFIDTFLKSLLAGASVKQVENSLHADILISPDLSKFGLLNVTQAQQTQLIKIGYLAAVKAINEWEKKK